MKNLRIKAGYSDALMLSYLNLSQMTSIVNLNCVYHLEKKDATRKIILLAINQTKIRQQ